MDDNRFDNLSKALATGAPRRMILKALGAGILGLVIGDLSREKASADSNSDCAHFCVDTFPPASNGVGDQRGDCISAAAHDTGPCCSPNGKTCGGFVSGQCNGGQAGCFCFQTPQGAFCGGGSSCGPVCGPGNTCPPGFICELNTCCGPSTCIPISTACSAGAGPGTPFTPTGGPTTTGQ